MPRYTLDSGRLIRRDGVPFVIITRPADCGTLPHVADDVAHHIVNLLNRDEVPAVRVPAPWEG